MQDNSATPSKLDLIANLLGMLLTQNKSLVDSAWILRNAGMGYDEIGRLLGISAKAASAHVSNRKKQLEGATKRKSGKAKARGESDG